MISNNRAYGVVCSLVTDHSPVATIHNGRRFLADNIVLCVPPKPLRAIIGQIENVQWPLNNFNAWVDANSYRDYYCVTFQWHNDVLVDQKRIWGFPATEHGLVYIVLSDYFKPGSEPYATIISTAITKGDNLQLHEIKEIAFKELQQSYKLPLPDVVIIGSRPGDDTAYIQSVSDPRFLAPKLMDSLYTVGSHNGATRYAFTTIESACASAFAFVGEPVVNAWTLNQIFGLFFILLVMIALICIITHTTRQLDIFI